MSRDLSEYIDDYVYSQVGHTNWAFLSTLKKEEIDFYEDLEKYYEEYKPKEMKNKEITKTRKKYIEGGIFVLLLITIIYFYKK